MRKIDADNLIERIKAAPIREKNKVIGLIHTERTAPTVDYPIEQIKWERDIAVEQLKAIGKGLGETMDDIQPVKTGKWIDATKDDPCYYYCSDCHWLSDIKTPYCPDCGARMTEGSEE